MELLPLCQDLIAINSVTVPNGTEKIVKYLVPLFERLGLKVKTQEFAIAGRPNLNLLASLGPESGDAPFLVNTHLDTVSPGNEKAWTKCHGNPFAATIHEDFLYGLGVADTKLALACLMIALHQSPKKLRQPLRILATAGEEHGLLGAHHAMETNFVKACYALDSEPSELNLVWAHKGLCATSIHFIPKKKFAHPEKPIFALSCEGEAAHSSTPDLGKNALDQAFHFLSHFPSKRNPHLLPCLLEGGNAPNVIPAKATLYFSGETAHPFQELSPGELPQEKKNLLLPPEIFYAAALYRREMQNLAAELHERKNPEFDPPTPTTATTLAEVFPDPPRLSLLQDLRFIEPEEGREFFAHQKMIGKQIEKKFPDVEIQVKMERHNDPLYGRKDSPFVERLSQVLQFLGLSGKRVTKAGCTEGALFAKAGMETIVVGPGSALNNIHKPNEKVALSQLHKAVEFYQHVIERFCA